MKSEKAILEKNPKTGLSEGFNTFYKVPIVHQKSVGRTKFAGQRTAIHKIPLGEGRTIDFFARLTPNDELLVTFHGAYRNRPNQYPRFPRVTSLKKYEIPHIAFADPTISTAQKHGVRLAWYLGGAGWDPNYQLAMVVRKAMAKSQAKHVAFIGGSGGGFAALRLAALFPKSLAYVQEPSVDISFAMPSTKELYFNTMWHGHDPDALIEGFPERFNLAKHYPIANPDNFVYYVQARDNEFYVENHYKPFKQGYGIQTDSGATPSQKRVFKLFDASVPGHGNITTEEFDHFFEDALGTWRENR